MFDELRAKEKVKTKISVFANNTVVSTALMTSRASRKSSGFDRAVNVCINHWLYSNCILYYLNA